MPPTSEGSAPVGADETVLIVDDQAFVGEAVRRVLHGAGGFRTVWCGRAQDAVATALRERPSVILQDLVMPDGDGLALVEAYRRERELAGVPVVVLSVREEAATKADAFARGASDYLVKLPDTVELVARLRHHAAASRAARERDAAFAELEAMHGSLRDKNRQLDEMNHRLSDINAELAEDVVAARERIAALNRLGEELSTIQSIDVLVERILHEACRFAQAQAAVLLVRAGDVLRPEFVHAPGGGDPGATAARLDLSCRGLAGSVAMTGDARRVRDPLHADPPLEADIVRAAGVQPRAALAMPLRTWAGNTIGVVVLLNPVTETGAPRDEFGVEDEWQLRHFASMASVALERTQMMRAVLLRMVAMAETRDPTETGAHVQRVAGYSLVLFDEWARRHGIEPDAARRERDRLFVAALLHDVGKVGIADAILKKPGPLDPDERAAMQRHTEIGARLFRGFQSSFDEAARDVALNHHERWDGAGYPGVANDGNGRRGKRGEEIPLFARIVAVADVLDALSSRRAYKEAWDEDAVFAALREDSGRHFDPELIEIAIARRGALHAVRVRVDSGKAEDA